MTSTDDPNLIHSHCMKNGVSGNYDLSQSELAENPTLQAQRDSFRIDRYPGTIDHLAFEEFEFSETGFFSAVAAAMIRAAKKGTAN
jgi:hypothetical protein